MSELRPLTKSSGVTVTALAVSVVLRGVDGPPPTEAFPLLFTDDLAVTAAGEEGSILGSPSRESSTSLSVSAALLLLSHASASGDDSSKLGPKSRRPGAAAAFGEEEAALSPSLSPKPPPRTQSSGASFVVVVIVGLLLDTGKEDSNENNEFSFPPPLQSDEFVPTSSSFPSRESSTSLSFAAARILPSAYADFSPEDEEEAEEGEETLLLMLATANKEEEAPEVLNLAGDDSSKLGP